MSGKFKIKKSDKSIPGKAAAVMLVLAASVAGITFMAVTEDIKNTVQAETEQTLAYGTPDAGLSTEILLASIDTEDFSIDLLSVSPVAQENIQEQEAALEAISAAVSEIEGYVDAAYENASEYSDAQEAYDSAKSLLDRALAAQEAAQAADTYFIAAMYVQEVADLTDDAAAYAQQAQEAAAAQAAEIAAAQEAAAKAAAEAAIAQERQDLVDYALSFVGVLSYKYGGSSLTYGADCSGFTMAVYAAFGYSLPHSSSSQASCGRAVSISEIEIGDLVCYYGHVGIYIGNGMIVHSPQTGKKVCTQSMYYKTIRCIRRIIE